MAPTVTVDALTDLAIIDILRLDDDALLREAKTFVIDQLLCEGLIGEFPTADTGELEKIAAMLGFLREKTARYAGKHLASLLRPYWGGAGDDICKKLDYCNTRDDIHATIARVRNALATGAILMDLLHLTGTIKEIMIALKALIVLPASVALFTLLYALDDLCNCERKPPKPSGKFDRKKGQSFDL
jgi:hypothetical protein